MSGFTAVADSAEQTTALSPAASFFFPSIRTIHGWETKCAPMHRQYALLTAIRLVAAATILELWIAPCRALCAGKPYGSSVGLIGSRVVVRSSSFWTKEHAPSSKEGRARQAMQVRRYEVPGPSPFHPAIITLHGPAVRPLHRPLDPSTNKGSNLAVHDLILDTLARRSIKQFPKRQSLID